MYKICNPATDMFSTGGSDPRWSTAGKVWKRRGDLSSHFTNLSAAGRREYANSNAVVVEIEVVLSNPTPVEEYINASSQRAADREQAAKDAADKRKRDRDLAELTRLQKLYGKDL